MKIATCHPARKEQARGLCKSCYDKWLKSVNPEYKQKQLSNTLQWAAKNPDRMKIIYNRRQAKEKADPNRFINQRNKLLKRYGLAHETYLILLETQNNSCKLCFRKPKLHRFHVDHCHTTGIVRGILCHQCNWYMGTIDADPTIIDRILAYRSANNVKKCG